MAINLTNLTASVNNIQALSDEPSNDGLTAAELKAKFDKAGADIKTFINDSLINELEQAFTTLQPKITYGTSDPSGGSNGDIYIKYTA